MSRRENTFRIDFAGFPKRPKLEEIHLFVGTQLGLKRGEVKRIQCSRSSACAFVKVCDLELAQTVVSEHDNKHEVEIDGHRLFLRLRMEDGAVAVKLYDLSESITHEQIAEYLSAFGDVLSIHEELCDDEKYMFGRIPTGTMIARMKVMRNIPSCITIDGDTTYVAYYGQRQTCRHCGEFVHNGASCVQNKKLMIQKLAADSTKPTYANVAKSSSSPKNNKKQPPTGAQTRNRFNTTASNSSTSTTTINSNLLSLSGSRSTSRQECQITPLQTTVITPTQQAPELVTRSDFRNTAVPNISTAQQTLTIPSTDATNEFRVPCLPSVGEDKAKNVNKNNDEDTDGSTTSTSSRRSTRQPPGKKQKHGNGNVSKGDAAQK